MVASRAGREALLARLADFPDRLEAAALEAATALPDGEWETGQILGHLLAVEAEVWQAQLSQMAVEENPAWTWTEPGFGDGLALTTQELLAEFRAGRASTLALVGDLDEAGWLRVGTHAVFGTLTVAMLPRETVRHDDEHAVELERRRSGEPGEIGHCRADRGGLGSLACGSGVPRPRPRFARMPAVSPDRRLGRITVRAGSRGPGQTLLAGVGHGRQIPPDTQSMGWYVARGLHSRQVPVWWVV